MISEKISRNGKITQIYNTKKNIQKIPKFLFVEKPKNLVEKNSLNFWGHLKNLKIVIYWVLNKLMDGTRGESVHWYVILKRLPMGPGILAPRLRRATFFACRLSLSSSLVFRVARFLTILSQIEVSRVEIAAVSCVQGDFKLRDLTRAFF